MDNDQETQIRKAQSGDSTAFHQLFLENHEKISRIVQRILGPSSDVEDVVQEVFINLHRSLPSFRGDSKFTTWLYRLTINVTKMHLRKQYNRPQNMGAPMPERSTPYRQSVERPDAAVEKTLRVLALYKLLDKLSDKKREVLVLHDFEGISATEIAEILNTSVLTVRTRLFYARKELFEFISKEPSLQNLASDFMNALPGKPSQDN